jgi:acetyl esterase/lipase
MAPLLSYQPFKAVATLCLILSVPPYLALYSLLNLPRSRRPIPQWSLKTVLGTKFLQILFKYYTKVQFKPTIRTQPGSLKDRLVAIPPAKPSLYKGVLQNTGAIQPATVYGIWYPRVYNADQHSTVVIHFQGGAYVLAAPPEDVAPTPSRIYSQKLGALTFLAQYRVSRTETTRFPAALTDAVTFYQWVLSLGISAQNIIISGDSAGGNLALALLRYIENHGAENLLPVPRGALLWSPWVDLSAASPAKYASSPSLATDFVSPGLIQWGKAAFLPVPSQSGPPEDTEPYTSPLRFPFRCRTPLFIQAGTAELLHGEIAELAERMQKVDGNRVRFWEVEGAPHDVILCGHVFGMVGEAEECAERAAEFFGFSD